MKKVIVNTTSKSYPVFIGSNIFRSLPEFIRKFNLPKRVCILLDEKVEKIYGSGIRKVINGFTVKKYFVVLPASEKIKSFETVTKIFSRLYNEQFGRDTLLIAIGGGAINDVAGFTASTYIRVLPLVHVPTTLLSAVDSSIGGKTGINFKEAKNFIGTFYQPSLVLTDSNFLSSLPEEELISGFGEVIKYSYLTNRKFYSTLLSDYKLLKKKDSNFLNKIIYESVKIKTSVVSKDENEITGLRKILNFGHTFAHAYESNSSYKLAHGKSVIAGIVSALFLSFEKGLMDEIQLNYMLELPLKFLPSIKIKNINKEDIFRIMTYDKKNREGKIKFILLKNFGEILIDVDIDKKLIFKSLEITDQVWFKRATAGL